MAPAKKTPAGKPRKPRRKKVEAGSKGLTPADMAVTPPDGEKLAALIREDGGAPLGVFDLLVDGPGRGVGDPHLADEVQGGRQHLGRRAAQARCADAALVGAGTA